MCLDMCLYVYVSIYVCVYIYISVFGASPRGPAWASEARAMPDHTNCAHDAFARENMGPNCADDALVRGAREIISTARNWGSFSPWGFHAC